MTERVVAYPTASPPVEFGVDRLVDALRAGGATVSRRDGDAAADVRVTIDDAVPEVEAEGFAIRRPGDAVRIVARDDAGAMYGALELAERVRRAGDLGEVAETVTNPAVEFRGIKFNLPWSPYRGGEGTEIHYETCRDLEFWAAFLDMMAEHRFNALTLWNLHPFPYMIRPEQYPEACPFSGTELAEWQDFWHALFEMADDRGIETYVLNWNIVVSESFAAAHDVAQYNDRSDLVREYTRECVTQTIEEYPNLDGLGVSLCDWMSDMSPAEKQDWFVDTFVEGIADADRTVNLLDRSVLTESIEEMRRGIDRAAETENVGEIRVPTKFNWSHGHSTTALELTHDYSSGDVDDTLWNPPPENYEIAWTIRNEDFAILRWGDPDFVREHVAENAVGEDHVGGYVVGSEAFIPATDYSHELDAHRTWEYAFEKQWLLYAVWGRLLYDPGTPDAVFEQAFAERYRPDVAERLLEGYRRASTVPEEIASFHAGTWDYSLYAEGFLAPSESFGLDDGASPFISIDELIDHETLDADYRSIPEYVGGEDSGVTPPELADRVEADARRAREIADELRVDLVPGDGALECEVDDIEAWGHLGEYFAEKLRAGVALESYREGAGEEERRRAVTRLQSARDHWDGLVAVTDRHYREVPYATDRWAGTTFSWATYRDQVERDIRIAKEAEPRGG